MAIINHHLFGGGGGVVFGFSLFLSFVGVGLRGGGGVMLGLKGNVSWNSWTSLVDP